MQKMAKFALKKCSFWQKLHFYGAILVIFWEGMLFGSTRSDWTLRGGLENYIKVVSVII